MEILLPFGFGAFSLAPPHVHSLNEAAIERNPVIEFVLCKFQSWKAWTRTQSSKGTEVDSTKIDWFVCVYRFACGRATRTCRSPTTRWCRWAANWRPTSPDSAGANATTCASWPTRRAATAKCPRPHGSSAWVTVASFIQNRLTVFSFSKFILTIWILLSNENQNKVRMKR